MTAITAFLATPSILAMERQADNARLSLVHVEEVRWRSDLTAHQRSLNLPWFPFEQVLEKGQTIKGYDHRKTVVETGRRLLVMAHPKRDLAC